MQNPQHSKQIGLETLVHPLGSQTLFFLFLLIFFLFCLPSSGVQEQNKRKKWANPFKTTNSKIDAAKIKYTSTKVVSGTSFGEQQSCSENSPRTISSGQVDLFVVSHNLTFWQYQNWKTKYLLTVSPFDQTKFDPNMRKLLGIVGEDNEGEMLILCIASITTTGLTVGTTPTCRCCCCCCWVLVVVVGVVVLLLFVVIVVGLLLFCSASCLPWWWTPSGWQQQMRRAQ